LCERKRPAGDAIGGNGCPRRAVEGQAAQMHGTARRPSAGVLLSPTAPKGGRGTEFLARFSMSRSVLPSVRESSGKGPNVRCVAF
jgi:hypothetical protein